MQGHRDIKSSGVIGLASMVLRVLSRNAIRDPALDIGELGVGSRLRLSETAKAKVLHLQKFIHAVVRALSPEARLLDAPERGDLR